MLYEKGFRNLRTEAFFKTVIIIFVSCVCLNYEMTLAVRDLVSSVGISGCDVYDHRYIHEHDIDRH